MGHINTNSLTYNFSQKAQRNLWILLGVGIVMLIVGAIMWHAPEHGGHEGHEDHTGTLGQRLWANLLVNGYFFGGISLAALFFYAMQYAAQASWSVVFMRIFAAVTDYLWIGLVVIFVVIVAGDFHLHHLYHWQDSSAYENDHILQHKAPYFNRFFYYGRIILFFLGYIWYQRWIRKSNMLEDSLTNFADATANWNLNLKNAAIFLVFFGFTSSVMSWDVIMSIDVHWYSTLFGWYNFAGWWIGAIVVFNMLVIHLKSRGQMEFVNPSHVHDLGKWMFAVSVLWTYLWFSQFMLIWYSNIPEEVTYFVTRIEQYNLPFFGMLALNFIFPVLILINTDFKRITWIIVMGGVVILFGHYIDFFTMIMPATVGDQWFIGVGEISSLLFFFGLFLLVVFTALTKAPLVPKRNPFIEESKHFHY